MPSLLEASPQSPNERMISSCSCAFFKRFNPRYRSSSLLLLYKVFYLTFKLQSNNPHVIVRNNTNLLFRIKPCIVPNNAWYHSELLFRSILHYSRFCTFRSLYFSKPIIFSTFALTVSISLISSRAFRYSGSVFFFSSSSLAYSS